MFWPASPLSMRSACGAPPRWVASVLLLLAAAAGVAAGQQQQAERRLTEWFVKTLGGTLNVSWALLRSACWGWVPGQRPQQAEEMR